MISEAIRSADSEQTICFLLSEYVETLRLSGNLPEHLTALPIIGLRDIKSRFDKLLAETEIRIRLPGLSAYEVVEALSVFDIAINRLVQFLVEGCDQGGAKNPSHPQVGAISTRLTRH